MLKEFLKIIQEKNTTLANYVLKRTGDELLKNRKNGAKVVTLDRIKNKILYFYLAIIRLLIPKNLRDLVFSKTPIGEKHQWMYDSFSLKEKLDILGFRDITIKRYNDSDIPNFNYYLLDIKEDGSPYKGVSSLYIEAKK